MPLPLDAWILLRLERTSDGFVLHYSDSADAQVAGEAGALVDQWHFRPLAADLGDLRMVAYAPALRTLIQQIAGPFPDFQFSPHSTGPKPVAVFLEESGGVDLERWLSFARTLLAEEAGLNAQRFTLVVAPRRVWLPRPRFRLPIRVLAVGRHGSESLTALTDAYWYQGSSVIRSHGITIGTTSPSGLRRALQREPWDVVVSDAEWTHEILRATARMRARVSIRRPRVVVSLGGRGSEMPSELMPPPGVSLVVGNPEALASQFLAEFIQGIVHDYPLHEAVTSAMRSVPVAGDVLLFADPLSNQSVRMADALDDLVERMNKLTFSIQLPDVDAFLQRMGDVSHVSHLSLPLQLGATAYEPIREVTLAAGHLPRMFGRESQGLEPLARAEAMVERGEMARAEAEAPLAELMIDEQASRRIAETQERRADICVEVSPPGVAARPVFARWDRDWQVPRGARCRVRVHLGNRGAESVVVGEPDSLDVLLPPAEDERGHVLDVAFFPKNFRLDSPSVRALTLPRLGGSQPVYFEFNAPDEDVLLEARVGIYHKDNLVQSFRFRAAVGFVADLEGHAIEAVQDFSRSRVFANLNELGERELSIGLNRSGAGTHSLLWKRGAQAEIVTLPEALLQQQIEIFRQKLRAATLDAQEQPRFPSFPQAGARPGDDARRAVRELARFGDGLYRALWPEASRSFKDTLREVREDADRTIQVARHDSNFVFPWTVLYDRGLPDHRPGDPEPAVCFGKALDDGWTGPGDPAAQPVGCPHNPGRDVICVDGFWGVRHRVEEVLPIEGSDPRPRLKTPPGRAAVVLALGIEDDFTRRLTSTFQAELGSAWSQLAPGGDLLELLWSDQTRPAITVVLGHVETKERTGEPPEPRIRLMPTKGPDPRMPLSRWLLASTIQNAEMSRGAWVGEPDGLVLLLGCGSGAVELTTLNSFVTALASAGAAGIVGTEIPLGSGLAARFAAEVVPRVYAGMPVGAAIQAFARTLLSEGNPSPFMFNLIGNADLEMAPSAGDGT